MHRLPERKVAMCNNEELNNTPQNETLLEQQVEFIRERLGDEQAENYRQMALLLAEMNNTGNEGNNNDQAN